MGSSKRNFIWMLLALFFVNFAGYAQTWDEIFKQKKTQIKYLGQQIVALQLYIGYAKKGYDLVGGGIGVVRDVTNGEFSLHRNFFASLSAVSPAVKNSSRVAEIGEYGLSIIALVKSWKPLGLTPDEWVYLALVKANLLAGCANDLEELVLIITSGKLEMKDDERLERLDELWLSLQDRYEFAASFTTSISQLKKQRENEQSSVNQFRRLYEIE